MSTEDRLGRAIEKMKGARVTLALIRESVPEKRFEIKRAKNSLAPDDIERMMSYGIIESIEDGHKKYYSEDYK